MNSQTFNEQEKIANFNAMVGNNNDKIAREFLMLKNWDETEAVNLYLDSVSLPNNDNYNYNSRVLQECRLKIDSGLVDKAFSFFKSSFNIYKNNVDCCKDFEGKIRGLVKRGEVFMNLLKINKGVIIIYNVQTKHKLLEQLDMINKDPDNNYLKGVIILPVIDNSEEGTDLIKQLTINRFPCYIFCRYKTQEIFYVVDKMEGIFYLDTFKYTLSPRKNIINNSSINLQPNNNKNNMPNIQNNNYNSSINLKNNISLPNSNSSNINKNNNTNKLINNKENNSNNSQQNNKQYLENKDNNNNISKDKFKEFFGFNKNIKENISFPKDNSNDFSIFNEVEKKEKTDSNNNKNVNNLNNSKNQKIDNNKNNLNEKKEESKEIKKEYIPDYRDYDLDDELVYNPQTDKFEKMQNIINSLNNISINNNNNKNNTNNSNNSINNHNMNNYYDQYMPMSDRDIRRRQDNEMKELEKIEEERLKREREENEKKKREEQKEKERIQKEKEEKELFSLLIPPEPEDDNPDKCIIIFRLPDGKNIQRKFLKSDKISVLYDYIKSLGKDIYTEEEYNNFSIIQTFPFKNFEDKLNCTLEEEGLFPNSMLQIKESD